MRFHDPMHHEFTHVGSNALLSSHVCSVCGLVVSLVSSQTPSALPLDGCCVRNDAEPLYAHQGESSRRQ
jgi:hypothetical protein